MKVTLIDFGTCAFLDDCNGHLFTDYVGTFAYAVRPFLTSLAFSFSV